MLCFCCGSFGVIEKSLSAAKAAGPFDFKLIDLDTTVEIFVLLKKKTSRKNNDYLIRGTLRSKNLEVVFRRPL